MDWAKSKYLLTLYRTVPEKSTKIAETHPGKKTREQSGLGRRIFRWFWFLQSDKYIITLQNVHFKAGGLNTLRGSLLEHCQHCRQGMLCEDLDPKASRISEYRKWLLVSQVFPGLVNHVSCGKEEDRSRAAPDFSNDPTQALDVDGSHESSNTLAQFLTHVTHTVPCAGVTYDCAQRLWTQRLKQRYGVTLAPTVSALLLFCWVLFSPTLDKLYHWFLYMQVHVFCLFVH